MCIALCDINKKGVNIGERQNRCHNVSHFFIGKTKYDLEQCLCSLDPTAFFEYKHDIV